MVTVKAYHIPYSFRSPTSAKAPVPNTSPLASWALVREGYTGITAFGINPDGVDDYSPKSVNMTLISLPGSNYFFRVVGWEFDTSHIPEGAKVESVDFAFVANKLNTTAWNSWNDVDFYNVDWGDVDTFVLPPATELTSSLRVGRLPITNLAVGTDRTNFLPHRVSLNPNVVNKHIPGVTKFLSVPRGYTDMTSNPGSFHVNSTMVQTYLTKTPAWVPYLEITYSSGFPHLDIDSLGNLRQVAAGSGHYLTYRDGGYIRHAGTETSRALILDDNGVITVKE